MTVAEVRDRLDDETALALTMWGEARGDQAEGGSSLEERVAVGCVVRNRARRSSRSLKAECLLPLQFSCWNEDGGRNHQALMQLAARVVSHELLDVGLIETLYLASGIAGGVIRDVTAGATHYYAPAAMQPPGRVPRWAVGRTPVARVGGHVFFRLVDDAR